MTEIQDVLGVPWAPASFQAYAAYPRLHALLWSRAEPVARTQEFLDRALALRDLAYREVGSWYWRGSTMPGIDDEERKRIRWELEAFEYGNAQLLLLQSLFDLAMRDGVVGAPQGAAPARRHGGAPFRTPDVTLVAEPTGRVARLLAGVKPTIDEQSFAKWPAFFEMAWTQAKRWREEQIYFELCGALTREAHAHAMTLSPPVALGVSDLRAAVGEREGHVENAQRLIQLQSSKLPAQIVNDAIYLFALEGPMFAQPPREEITRP
jgi:hypothetical protein